MQLAAESVLTQRLRSTARAKRRLIVDPQASFIRGPSLDNLPQVISIYDVSTNGGWYDGLNSAVWDETQLLDSDKKLVSDVLDKTGFQITPAREDRGRGILTPQAYREGDTIANLPCLWFDQVPRFS